MDGARWLTVRLRAVERACVDAVGAGRCTSAASLRRCRSRLSTGSLSGRARTELLAYDREGLCAGGFDTPFPLSRCASPAHAR
eukprot:5156952-Prymnesium_polylepis.1